MRRAQGRRAALQRGLTLVEVMIAMAILLLGVLGLLGAQMIASQQNSAAAKQNRGTALARDILAAVDQWDYEDTRLTDSNTDNNDVVLSSGSVGAPEASDYDLDLNGSGAAGGSAVVAGTRIDFNADGQPDYRRYLVVAPHTVTTPAGNETVGRRVSAVVFWRELAGWRRVVLHAIKYDPELNKATVSGL